jgi:hypothetical protein
VASKRPVRLQPDFARFAHQTLLAHERSAVTFKPRPGASFYYDIAFLSAMTHEASFTLDDVSSSKGQLRLRLLRERWVSTPDGGQADDLCYNSSSLTLSPVLGLQWSWRGLDLPPSGASLELFAIVLHGTYLNPDSDHFFLDLLGVDWRLRVQLDKTSSAISLRDLEGPRGLTSDEQARIRSAR